MTLDKFFIIEYCCNKYIPEYIDCIKISQVFYSPGHGANSQFGPCLPTADPSGQILASIVQNTASSSTHDS